MNLLKEGKTNWKYILIVVILAAIIGGGILILRWLEWKGEIKKSYIKVISPNGEEIWIEGKTYDITWGSSGIEKVDIQVARVGKDLGNVATGIDAKLGKYSWKIPIGYVTSLGMSKPDLMRIKIYDTENQNISDFNDKYFIIKEEEREWTDYIEYVNHKLGFSMKVPKNMPGLNRCVDPGETETQFFVPVKVLEDNDDNTVYITAEYYYDDWKSGGECKKLLFSLGSLRKGEWGGGTYRANNIFLGWVIIFDIAKNDNELSEFIKDNYGSGCLVKDKREWLDLEALEGRKDRIQEAVFDVEITGEDWGEEGIDLGTTTCPINYQYKVLYSPERTKAMSVTLGQECTFFTDFKTFRCYDGDMLRSFKFE